MNKTGKKGFLTLLSGIVIRPRGTLRYLYDAKRRWWALVALLMIAVLIGQQVAYARADAQYKYEQQLAWFENTPEEERGPMMQPPQLITPPGADRRHSRAGARRRYGPHLADLGRRDLPSGYLLRAERREIRRHLRPDALDVGSASRAQRRARRDHVFDQESNLQSGPLRTGDGQHAAAYDVLPALHRPFNGSAAVGRISWSD